MCCFTNKNIIVAISGSIAAYKSAELVRLLKLAGAQVEVVMTTAATQFITPLTLQALSGKPVHQQLLDANAEAGMGHIQLARWADALLIAPASANIIARLVQGLADDLLTTLCLATRAPILLVPAMNQAMWLNAATQANIVQLQQRGYTLLGPASGEQACGDVGLGRMLEPAQLLEHLAHQFVLPALQGRKVVITAGSTREPIDSVRYISNHSSGKMGYALATAARDSGAEVVLISGPTTQLPPDKVQLVVVETASQMLAASRQACVNADLFIASAAVADYRPMQVSAQKIKKSAQVIPWMLKLEQNPDILATVASQFPNLICVGFAAETEHLIRNTQAKLKRKQVAMMIANDISDNNIGFNSDDNRVSLVTENGVEQLAIQPKRQLARLLIERLAQL
jgi:phosphopantothenoylcysteine decarboxylase / phosphopantothenate---cysteine ligase